MQTYPTRHGGSVVGVLATLALLIVIIAAVIFAMGYATVDNSKDKTTIEVNTQQIKEDAGQAVESGKKLLNEAGASIEEGAEEVKESVSGDSTPETKSPTTPPVESGDETAN